jgi:putative two-component system hydrogenase maturation factor HypX/HoxX
VALTEMGHRVTVAVVADAAAMEAAVARHRPELIVCPMLKAFIPESIWRHHRCLVVHLGPRGDRGASSLDWAIELGMAEWGVTVLEASGEADAGNIWATRTFPIGESGKSSLYRHQVRRAAIDAVVAAVEAITAGRRSGEPLDYGDPRVTGRLRPPMRQDDRAIDWRTDSTADILRRIRAAEGHPGVLATVDGAVWISHLKAPGRFKLPATQALALAGHGREEELARSYECFFGPDRSYHEARRRFVYKRT